MRFLKGYMVGFFTPCTYWFLLYVGLYLINYAPLRERPWAAIALLAPIIWGAWNNLFLSFSNLFPGKTLKTKITFAGMILGVIVGFITAFIIPIFQLLIGWGIPLKYGTLIFYPFIYMILWRFIVHRMNEAFDLYKES